MIKKLFEDQGKKLFEETNKESTDILKKRIEKLKEVFPSIVSDGKIDFNMLKKVLGSSVTEDEDRYRFTWNNKSQAIVESTIKTTKTLRPESEEDFLKNTENLYIEGDNLEALKILQESYSNEIKMIYIDPPYNTGNDFIYEDKFAMSEEEAQQKEGLKDKNNKRIETLDNFKKNTKDSSKFHTEWLNMMYPRLSLANDLLKDDGVIFISIDDNEVHNLRKICDEIFGEKNFVAIFIRKTGATRAMAKHFDIRHDYVVVYSKNSEILKLNQIKNNSIKKYKNYDNDVMGEWDTQDLTVRGGGYEYIVPSLDNTEKFLRKWRFKEEELKLKMNGKGTETFEELYKNVFFIKEKGWYSLGEFVFKGKNKIINHKKYAKKVSTLVNNTLYENIGSNKTASNELSQIFGLENSLFSNPKPQELIKYLTFIGGDSNAVILDFFSGSATTAHAVMQLNAEDGGNRKYIMVQLPEETDEKSEAFKAGYKNICEIGKARIRKAAEQIKKEIEGKNKQLKLGEEPKKIPDLDFKTFKIDSTNFKEWEGSMEEIKNSIKDGAADIYTTYKKCRSEIDIISEVIIKEGYKLTDKIEIIEIDSEKIYKIADGLLYIFLKTLNNNIINKIIELYRKNKEELYIDNPKLILNETYMTTEIKSNIKKTLESEGIVDIKTL